ncbi:hypothetical protein BD309DRAFT_750121 [Dichomitus squalens]|nr:hypothetical protein BD309DRAFT_750121 [Dichomitus squalens]
MIVAFLVVPSFLFGIGIGCIGRPPGVVGRSERRCGTRERDGHAYSAEVAPGQSELELCYAILPSVYSLVLLYSLEGHRALLYHIYSYSPIMHWSWLHSIPCLACEPHNE